MAGDDVRRMAHAQMKIGGVHLLIALHGSHAPSEAEWSAYLATLSEVSSIAGVRLAGLAITDGGGPNSLQRKNLAALIAEKKVTPKGAAVTANPVVRGILTALSWIMRGDLRVFAPSSFEQALAHIGVPPEDVPRVREELSKLGSALPGRVIALEAIEAQTRTRRSA